MSENISDIETMDKHANVPKYGQRHVQTVMFFLAFVLLFMMRVNISVAIIDMTDTTKENTFDWNLQIKSIILSSFMWGYPVLNIVGGVLAKRFGSMKILLFIIVANSATCLFTPASATLGGWKLICACRVVQGLAQGMFYSAMHNIVSKWIPLEEKGRLGTFIYVGSKVGTAIQFLISGFIADSWGWPAIFYVNGALGIVWTILYYFIGSESPQTSKNITKAESLYIQTSLGQIGGQKKYPIPWKSLLTSLPMWSLAFANIGQNFGSWTLLTEIPAYMKKVVGVDIKSNGVISSIPYISITIASFPLGYISDYILKKKWISVNATRKLFNTIGFWGPSIFLLVLVYSPMEDVVAAVTILSLIVGFNAGNYMGFLLTHIDMAPNFAGIMMGITNTCANLASIAAPLLVGVILKDEVKLFALPI